MRIQNQQFKMEASHSPTVSTEIVRFQWFPVSSHETFSFIRVAGVHGMLQLVCPKHIIETNHPISQGQLLAILAPILNSSSFNTSFGYFYRRKFGSQTSDNMER